MNLENHPLSAPESTIESLAGITHDIAIIGAGPNGILLADELVRAGKRVLLFESGGFNAEEGLLTRDSYVFEAPSKMPTRIHTVGGGSTKWLGRVGQFIPADFLPTARRSEFWPLRYEELDNHFRKVFQKITSNGQLDREFIEKNEDLNRISRKLPKSLQLRIFRFSNLNAFSNILKDLVKNPNFTLVINTTCLEICPDQDYAYILKLNNSRSTNGFTTIKSRKVIVAGGTLQSTALILRSKELKIPAREKLLGKNLMEHFDGYVGSLVVKRRNNQVLNEFLLAQNRTLYGTSFGIAFSLSEEQVLSHEIPNLHFEVTEFKKKFIFETDSLFACLPHFIRRFLLISERAIRKVGDPILNLFDSLLQQNRYTIWMKGEEYPNKNSKIDLLDRSEAIFPKIVYKHKISRNTSEAVRAGLVIIKQVISEENLGQFRVYRHLLSKKHGFYLNPNWHPMGTMRMANNKLEGICDSNLEVFDNPGLFLLSAAVFPTGSNHNPTCMVMALGQRLADYLLNPID